MFLFLFRTHPHNFNFLATSTLIPRNTFLPVKHRSFVTTPLHKMPEKLTAEEVNSQIDPSVSKQWDSETPKKQQIEEFYKTVDGMKIGLLTTIRGGLGPVSRSMAVAKVLPYFYQPNLCVSQANMSPLACRSRLPLPRQQAFQQVHGHRQQQASPSHLPELFIPRLGVNHRCRRDSFQR